MNEFDNYMEIRESVSDLIDKILEIDNQKERIDNLEYAIKRLTDLKNESNE